jgi:diguanylate cyclase (GGDEF)-like protein/PAS domain S-box-containing protein
MGAQFFSALRRAPAWFTPLARSVDAAPAARGRERCRLALLGSGDGVWDWDLRGAFYLCPRWKAQLGLPVENRPDQPRDWLERVHPDDQLSLRITLEAHLSGRTDQFRHEHRLLHADGTYRSMLCRGRAVRHGEGRPTRITGTMTDISDHAVAEEHLRRAVLHDSLTGLPNRALLLPLVAEAIERHRHDPSRQFAVLFIDVDRFKRVNDAYGHAAGDALLVAVARRLEGSLRAADTPARYAGDEFVALLSGLDAPAQAHDIAARVQQALCASYVVAGVEMPVSASIGGVVGHPELQQAEALLQQADAAMYRAKSEGLGRLVFDGVHAAG